MGDQDNRSAGLARADIAAFHDRAPASHDFAAAFAAGMARPAKSIAGQMLADRRSPAFQRICALPEYYPCRAELEILRDHGAAIAEAIGPAAQLVDLGSGFGAQVSALLARLADPWGYVAIDHEEAPLLDDARRVQALHPRLWVEAVRADMRQGFDLPSNAGGGRRVAYLPGSAIGNFDPADALALLRIWTRQLRRGGLMLVGVDLRKSVLILEAAYDDVHGANALFTLGLLARANRELQADFDPRLFEHRVHYDADHGEMRIELVSVAMQDVRIGGRQVHFGEGEPIHIESSWKYSVEDFGALARGAGFRPVGTWTDARELFSLHLLEVG